MADVPEGSTVLDLGCGAGDHCSHRELLDHMRSGARAAGVLFRAGEPVGNDPVEEWPSRLASKWPCSILFDDDGQSTRRTWHVA